MNGTIEFSSLAELAEFLQAFTGSTAHFRTTPDPTIKGHWVLEFLGGF